MKQLFAFMMMLLAACGTTSVDPADGATLSGTWLLYETGYSPGAGYIVEPVDPEPPQTMNFSVGGRFTSNIDGLENFAHYGIFDDPLRAGKVLALYKKDPGAFPKLESSSTTYSLERDGVTLKLYFRFCIEGCHLALRKN